MTYSPTDIHLTYSLTARTIISAVAQAHAAAHGNHPLAGAGGGAGGAAAAGVAIIPGMPIPRSSSLSGGSGTLSTLNVYGIADCGARTELTVTELYDQLRLLVLVTNDTLRFMEAMCSATEFETIFGF